MYQCIQIRLLTQAIIYICFVEGPSRKLHCTCMNHSFFFMVFMFRKFIFECGNKVYSKTAFSESTVMHSNVLYRKGTSIRQAPVFRHLRALRKSPWKFIIWMNELLLHCMLLVSYMQQYFNTSITVLTNQGWKLLIALFKVPNTGAFTVHVHVHVFKLCYKYMYMFTYIYMCSSMYSGTSLRGPWDHENYLVIHYIMGKKTKYNGTSKITSL